MPPPPPIACSEVTLLFDKQDPDQMGGFFVLRCVSILQVDIRMQTLYALVLE